MLDWLDDHIALILIAESPESVIKLAIHLGSPGLISFMDYIAKTPVTDRKDESKTYWRTVGAGFAKNDGKISIELYGLPVNGRIVLFEPNAQEVNEESSA